MFYYYGMKRSYIEEYPSPKYKKIIEPFAGSATYSMRYWYHDVVLFEKDERLYKLWKYLINKATKKRILSLPILKQCDRIDHKKFNYLKEEEKYLIGYNIQYSSSPSIKPSANLGFNKWNEKNRKKIAENLYKIKHWKIYNESYENLKNYKGTWFIDPPYQGKGGEQYKHNNKHINYKHLAKWCRERKGQIIVCENKEGKWLPFKKLKKICQKGKNNIEMVYLKNN